MTFTLTDFFLEFKTPFSIAHGTRLGTDLVFLRLESDGIVAYGEASLPPYLPENRESVKGFIGSFFAKHGNLAVGLTEMLRLLEESGPGNFAAKACVDIALHNWYAGSKGVPVYQMLNLANQPRPPCTYTIGMDTREVILEKVAEASQFGMLKVKLGGENDRLIMETIRSVTDKALCVDVNQGWRSREQALEMITWLRGLDVLFVEQPLSREDTGGQEWLHERSPLPIVADEAVQVPDDVDRIRHLFDGINVKLMKCGGIGQGLKMIRKAREYGLNILIGSMSESGCGISAAAQLSSLADWVDLDGPLLTRNNPFDIVTYRDGRIWI